jgi:hypothetical protein|tara:strand:+ start:281 stop:982 length:702 start_codon:yes stop_codon:yes gene_type:complete
MPTLSVELAIGRWRSKYSERDFAGWQHISLPKPAKNYVPQWFKDTVRQLPEGRSIKACMPVTDIFTAGYILPAPVDIFMYYDSDNGLRFNSPEAEFFVSRHNPTQYSLAPYSDDVILKFDFPWILHTPPGYSMMYQPPAHSDNSKIEALSAVVETDQYYNTVSCPVRIKDWKQGEVLELPKGYPLVQAIPFQREEWEMKTDYSNFGKRIKTTASFVDDKSAYKNNYREKKKWN